ncbi:hypothetical protein MWN34_19190, partial [Ancylobacter sp. 6x-1]
DEGEIGPAPRHCQLCFCAMHIAFMHGTAESEIFEISKSIHTPGIMAVSSIYMASMQSVAGTLQMRRHLA